MVLSLCLGSLCCFTQFSPSFDCQIWLWDTLTYKGVHGWLRLQGAQVLWLQNHLQSSALPTVLDGSEALLLICCVWVSANLHFSVICLNDTAPEVVWLIHIHLCSCVASPSKQAIIFHSENCLALGWFSLDIYSWEDWRLSTFFFHLWIIFIVLKCLILYKGTHVSFVSAVKQTGTYLYRSLSCGVQLRVTSAFPSTSSLNTLVMFWGPLTWKSWML